MKSYYVYMLSNESKLLYIGVTNNLEIRIWQHKTKCVPGFTARYHLHRLVYVEVFGDVRAAIAREKELKGWLRTKKVALIVAKNPKWKDLAADWFKNAPKKNPPAQRSKLSS